MTYKFIENFTIYYNKIIKETFMNTIHSSFNDSFFFLR